MKKDLIIVGTGVNAIQAYEFVKDYDLYNVIGFAVNHEYKTCESMFDLPVYDIEELDNKFDKKNILLFIGLLWNRLNADRKKLYLKLKEKDFCFANLISPKASIRGKLMGDNCWIHDFVTIQNNAKVGNNVAMMVYSLVGPGAVVGDHCFLGAKSTIGGGSKIGEQTFVGINCTVFDATNVGNKCILGACTAVKRNMPDYSLCKTASDNVVIEQHNECTIEDKLIHKKNKR